MAAPRYVGDLYEGFLGLDRAQREEFLCKAEARMVEDDFSRRREGLPEPSRCPRCRSDDIRPRGRDGRGRRRWRCRGCGRSFTADTWSVLSRSRLAPAAWAAFARCMAARMTLRHSAQACGVSLKTAWYMRMRLMLMLRAEAARFSTGPEDAVQADETFLPESFSGNRSGDPSFRPWRAPRRRGGGAAERECLLTLVGDGGCSDIRLDDGAERRGAAAGQLLAVTSPSTRVSAEMNSSSGSAAAALGRPVSRRYSGEHALNAVNSAHSGLKAFTAPFRGVSSRRMQLYAWWYSWHSSFRGGGAEARRAAALLGLVPVGRAPGMTRRGLSLDPYPVEARLRWREGRTKKG